MRTLEKRARWPPSLDLHFGLPRCCPPEPSINSRAGWGSPQLRFSTGPLGMAAGQVKCKLGPQDRRSSPLALDRGLEGWGSAPCALL